MNAQVNALAVLGSELYAGSDFTTADYNPANRIAKWDGTNWSAVGSGMNGGVNALAVSGSNIYARGYFTTVTNNEGMPVAANYIAKWDGTNWSALGSGMNNWVYALAVSGVSLYAGGTFTMAGGKVSAYVARAIINPCTWLSIQANVPGPKTNTLTFTGTPNSQYVTQFVTNLTTSPWFTLATNTAPANGIGTVHDLDKIQSAVDLGLIDEHTGFTCWFVESAPHLIRWPERKEPPDRPIRKGGPMPSLASQLVRAPGGP